MLHPTPALYVVATPLGNLGDITLRALALLPNVDAIAAEDTRHTKRLLDHYGISARLLAVHQHNENAAADGEAIVFVEVRLRSDARYGGAAASISAAKQTRLVRTAESFLAGQGRAYANRPCRFDVILLDRLDARSIEWIRGAFDAF